MLFVRLILTFVFISPESQELTTKFITLFDHQRPIMEDFL